MLSCLATNQRTASRHTGLGDALDDRGNPLGYDAAGRDVVGEEQRLGPTDNQVVDEHANEVEADRVVLVQGLSDRDLGADPIGRTGQEWALIGLERTGVEEACEAADPADHLGAFGLVYPDLHQLDGLVSGLDRNAGSLVGCAIHVCFSAQVVRGGRGHRWPCLRQAR